MNYGGTRRKTKKSSHSNGRRRKTTKRRITRRPRKIRISLGRVPCPKINLNKPDFGIGMIPHKGKGRRMGRRMGCPMGACPIGRKMGRRMGCSMGACPIMRGGCGGCGLGMMFGG
jgi:hypothetical protein